jgi:hypothetical protein
MAGTVKAESLTGNVRRYVRQCRKAGCACSFEHHNDGRATFVHDGPGGVERLEISARDVQDLEFNLWGDQVKPWIERLHGEGPG